MKNEEVKNPIMKNEEVKDKVYFRTTQGSVSFPIEEEKITEENTAPKALKVLTVDSVNIVSLPRVKFNALKVKYPFLFRNIKEENIAN